MKKLKGFTLIELLVALAVLGIIMGIAVVKLDFIGKYNERMEINSIVEGINYTRNNAISTGTQNYILFTDMGKAMKIAIDGKVDRIIRINSVKLDNNTGKTVFNSTGAPDLGAKYIFQGKNKEYDITIEIATGKVNLNEKQK